jgi:hypothetical protein
LKFKQEWIWKKMIEQELRENEVAGWLKTVDSHACEIGWWLSRDGRVLEERKPKDMGREF